MSKLNNDTNDIIEYLKTLVSFGERSNLSQVFINVSELRKLIKILSEYSEDDMISRSGVVAFLENLKFEPNAHWLAEVLQDKKRFPSIGGSQNE